MCAMAVRLAASLAVLACFADSSFAGDDVPVLAIRIASYDRLHEALGYVLKLAGNHLQPTLEHPAVEHLYGIADFDSSRPTELVLAAPQQPDDLSQKRDRLSVWIVPITAAGRKTVFSFGFDSKKGITARPKAKKLAANHYLWDLPDQRPKHVLIEGDVAFIGEDAELIERVREQHGQANAEPPLPDLVSVHLDWKAVPKAWKQQAAKIIFDLLSSKDQLGKQTLGFVLMSLFAEGDSLTVGFDISPDDQRAGFHVRLAAKPGSSLDQSFALFSRQPTRFAHLLDDEAAMNVALSLRLPESVTNVLKTSEKDLKNLFEQAFEKAQDGTESKADFQEFQESFLSVFRLWSVTGRLDTAWTIREEQGEAVVVGGWYALGVKNLEEPTRDLAIKQAKADGTGSAAIELANGRMAYRLTRDPLVAFAEDELYLFWGGLRKDSFAEIVGRGDSDRPERFAPPVLLETRADYAVRLLKEYRDNMPENLLRSLSAEPLAGRLRFAIDRGEHDVTASLDIDEHLLREMTTPHVKGFSQTMQKYLSEALVAALWPSSDSHSLPADATEPLNAQQ